VTSVRQAELSNNASNKEGAAQQLSPSFLYYPLTAKSGQGDFLYEKSPAVAMCRRWEEVSRDETQ